MDDFNLGVLTTTFTPAPDCLSFVSGLIYTETVTTNSTKTTIQHQYHTLGENNTSLCYPPYYHVGTQFYYSPAMCPSGWYAACGNFGSGTVPETRATCCPLGYSCMDSTTDIWSTLSCISSAQSSIFVTVPDNAYQVWSRVVELQPIINAGAINVRWQSSDFTTSTTPSSTAAPSSPVPSNHLRSHKTARGLRYGNAPSSARAIDRGQDRHRCGDRRRSARIPLSERSLLVAGTA
ncbi:hypothetical protein F4678DRAFT_425507 [Xylaria arbuscula]|nr:hypothetical protein F4678DRAFT_425507 [Xylaria arbuscula]